MSRDMGGIDMRRMRNTVVVLLLMMGGFLLFEHLTAGHEAAPATAAVPSEGKEGTRP